MSIGESAETQWSWLYAWSGDISSLVKLINSATPVQTLTSALDALDVLIDALPSSRDVLIQNATALDYLLSLPSPRHSLSVLLDDPTYALHPYLRAHLPPTHSFYGLVNGPADSRRKAAWSLLETSLAALEVLKEVGPGDMTLVDQGQGRSRLIRLFELASAASKRGTKEGSSTLELALDLLEELPGDKILVRAMVPHVTRLTVASRLSGSQRVLPFGEGYARSVLKVLYDVSTDGSDTRHAQMTSELAQPYLDQLDPHEPLYAAFTPQTRTVSPGSPLSSQDRYGRQSLARALDDPSSVVAPITVNPQDVLELVAPAYLHTLRSAPVPPLGIRSTAKPAHVDSQASAFAGKVYTQHEFRGKDMYMPVGLGGSGVFSRPASKHVDDYM